MARFRRVCFTLNNPSDDDCAAVSNTAPWSYLIWALEVGERGTPHVQGYGELRMQTSLSALRRWAPRAHFISAKGTASENLEYITKDGPLVIDHGEARQAGRRTDLDEARELADDAGMRAVVACCNLQAIRVAEKYLSYTESGRNWKPFVVWLWGPTGAGKSRWAQDEYPEAYWKDATKWWDGYDGHDDVVLDEFRGSWWTLDYMLRLLDRYPFRVECKGSSRQFRARRICITCNRPPNLAYPNCGEAINQLTRRIDQCIELGILDSEVGGNSETPTLEDVYDDLLAGL